MEEINKKLVTGVSEEEPLLTIELKYRYKDYIRAKELSYSYLNKKLINKILLFVMAFGSILILLIILSSFIDDSTKDLPRASILICIILNFSWIFMLYTDKKRLNPFSFILYFKLNHLSDFYRNRSSKEIKQLEILCAISFYTTHLVRKTSTINNTANQTKAILLGPFGDKIDYTQLLNLAENRYCIYFCPEVFIPKNQIKEENKENLKLVMKKIYFSQHGHV